MKNYSWTGRPEPDTWLAIVKTLRQICLILFYPMLLLGLWNQYKETLLKRGWQGEGWEGEPTAPCQLQENCQLQTQQKNPQQERIINYRSPQGRMHIASSTRNRPSLQLSQWVTVITLNSCFSPVDFPSKQPLPNFLLLDKITSFSFVCWTCRRLCSSLRVQNCNSLLFLNNLFC